MHATHLPPAHPCHTGFPQRRAPPGTPRTGRATRRASMPAAAGGARWCASCWTGRLRRSSSWVGAPPGGRGVDGGAPAARLGSAGRGRTGTRANIAYGVCEAVAYKCVLMNSWHLDQRHLQLWRGLGTYRRPSCRAPSPTHPTHPGSTLCAPPPPSLQARSAGGRAGGRCPTATTSAAASSTRAADWWMSRVRPPSLWPLAPWPLHSGSRTRTLGPALWARLLSAVAAGACASLQHHPLNLPAPCRPSLQGRA